MAIRIMPDQAFLRECFDYYPDTGCVVWRARPVSHFVDQKAQRRWNTMYAGKTAANTQHKFGHWQICLMDRNWLAHRLIWKWMTGSDPAFVDHRDRDASNNRWGNLRETDYSGNARNRTSINRLGLKGVRRQSKSSRFRASIRIDGKLVLLPGSYATPEEAHAAYCEAAKKHFGEFWSAG